MTHMQLTAQSFTNYELSNPSASVGGQGLGIICSEVLSVRCRCVVH